MLKDCLDGALITAECDQLNKIVKLTVDIALKGISLKSKNPLDKKWNKEVIVYYSILENMRNASLETPDRKITPQIIQDELQTRSL